MTHEVIRSCILDPMAYTFRCAMEMSKRESGPKTISTLVTIRISFQVQIFFLFPSKP